MERIEEETRERVDAYQTEACNVETNNTAER